MVIQVTCGSCGAGKTLTLSWAPNPEDQRVQGYIVYVGPTPETATTELSDLPIGEVGTTAPSKDYDAWNDLRLSLGDQACFRLKAYNSTGLSDFSQAACSVL